MQTLSFLGERLRPHGRLLTAAALVAVVFRLLPLQVPILAGALIDGLSGRGASIWGWPLPSETPAAAVQLAGAILSTLALATGLAAYLARRLSSRLRRSLNRELRECVFRAWQETSVGFQRAQGAIRFSTDILPRTRAVGRLAADSIVEGLAAGARLIYPALMLLLLDPVLALIPLAALPLQALLTRTAQQRESRFADEVQEAAAISKRAFREAVEGTETIQALNAQPVVRDQLLRADEEVEEIRDRASGFSRVLTGAAWSLAALGLALSWWVGGTRVAAGETTIGHLVTFAGFAALLGLPLRRFTTLSRRTNRGLRDLERVRRFLESAAADQGRRGKAGTSPQFGAIELRGVSFRPGGGDVLKEACATVPAGEFIWVRGPSGCGKSSLLRLIAGLDLPDEGTVLLGGQDLSACPAGAIRQLITLVPQNPSVFTGTLASNLRLADPEAAVEGLEAACALAGLAPLLNSLGGRLDTLVGEQGVRLSAGEAQRLAIARALLRRPRVLLLDEPTAPLDEEAELRLLEALGSLTPAVTVVMTAHQVRSLSRIDRVLEVCDGRIMEWPATRRREPIERRERECPSS